MRMFAAFILLLAPFRLAGQHAVDPAQRYFRLIGLVHLTGAGTVADPIRPEYVPSAAAATRDGILAWSFQLTDDKKMAIIHLVTANHHAFDALLNDPRPEIQIFEIGKRDRAVIEGALRLVKKDFDLDQFQVVAQ